MIFIFLLLKATVPVLVQDSVAHTTNQVRILITYNLNLFNVFHIL